MSPATPACYFLLLLVLTTATRWSSQSVHATYFIRPNSSTPCPSTECLSLEEFAEGGQLVENGGITLEFLSGIHYLSTGIILFNLESITMRPLLPDSSISVRCTKPAGLLFYNITYLEISRLLIDSCGAEGLEMYSSTIYMNATKFNDTTIVNSRGTAIRVLYSFLVLNSTQMVNCGYYDLNYETYGGAVNAYASDLVISGDTVFSYNSAQYGGAVAAYLSNLVISGHIVFSYNSAAFGGAVAVYASGLVISGDTVFSYNSAKIRGAGIYFEHGNLDVIGSATFTHNTAWLGGGMCISSAQSVNTSKRMLFINNTALGEGGAIWADHVPMLELSGTFVNNSAADSGGAIALSNTTAVSKGMLISENHAGMAAGGIFLATHSTLHIQSDSSTMQGNTAPAGGAVFVSSSDIIINATLIVANNSAREGGGCYLRIQSRFIFENEASLQFLGNIASYKGGAMYVEEIQKCSRMIVPFDPSSCHPIFIAQTTHRYIQVHYNSAIIAGSIFYGDTVCTSSSRPDRHNFQYSHISNVAEEENNSPSSIASDPDHVCFCESGDIQCDVDTIEFKAYPGQQFNVSVVAAGVYNGVVPSTVEAHLEPNSLGQLGGFQNSQETTTSCSNLSFALYSRNKSERITLNAGLCLTTSPVLQRHINVTLLECPLGFQLMSNLPYCGCQERLLQYTKDCTIDDQIIHRTNNFWVDYDNVTQGLVFHPHCPFDYCHSPPNNFTLQHSDQLCNYNRTRLLCGQCRHGLSLALGTSRCLNCSNYYLATLPAFVMAGVALVFILFICRLTVAMGTINGLIFYANIFHSNRTLFFPAGKTNILTVFIAWLNLDLGVEMCFYDGMDTYARTWLQFVFPVYVLILCGCIVFISRRSSKISRVLGTNPVAVLGTLFLLSYTKLLRTAMATLAFTTLSYPHNHTQLVWLYDANIGYLQGKHIPLFVVGLATLLLCLPYTILLLTSQWLRAWSNNRILCWVNSPRFTYLLDVYNAPYKPKHSYWTGLLLLTRLLLYLVYAVNALGNISINLLATCIAVAAVLGMGMCNQPYRSRLLGALETSFLLNLDILAVSTLYIQAAQEDQGALAYTSTAVSLAVFVAIVAFHSYQQIRNTRFWKTLMTRAVDQENEVESSDHEVDEDLNKQSVSLRPVTHSEIVLPGHNDQRQPSSEMHSNLPTDSLEDLPFEGQPPQQNEMACGPPELISSINSYDSQQSYDNLSSMPYTDAELREPLLSEDSAHY